MLARQPLQCLAAGLPEGLITHASAKRFELGFSFLFERPTIGLVHAGQRRPSQVGIDIGETPHQLVALITASSRGFRADGIQRAHGLVERGPKHWTGLIAAAQDGEPCHRAFDL